MDPEKKGVQVEFSSEDLPRSVLENVQTSIKGPYHANPDWKATSFRNRCVVKRVVTKETSFKWSKDDKAHHRPCLTCTNSCSLRLHQEPRHPSTLVVVALLRQCTTEEFRNERRSQRRVPSGSERKRPRTKTGHTGVYRFVKVLLVVEGEEPALLVTLVRLASCLRREVVPLLGDGDDIILSQASSTRAHSSLLSSRAKVGEDGLTLPWSAASIRKDNSITHDWQLTLGRS